EELGPAADAAVSTLLLVVVVLTAERSLGRLLAGHRVLLGGQPPFPFVLGLDHLAAHGFPPVGPPENRGPAHPLPSMNPSSIVFRFRTSGERAKQVRCGALPKG